MSNLEESPKAGAFITPGSYATPAQTQRQAWLAERRLGLGGSDIAAVLGLDPYTSPAQLYLDKTGIVETEETPAMRRGNFLEGPVVDAYCAMMQPSKVVQQVVHKAGKDGWRRGNQDARIEMADGRRICGEVKTIRKSVRRRDWGDQWSDEVPDRALCQSYWYGELDDASIIHIIACVIPDDPDEVMGLTADEIVAISDIEIFEVPRNETNELMIYQKAYQFWVDHVLACVPPPATLGTRDHKSLWPTASEGKLLFADDEMVGIMQRYEIAKANEKVAKGDADRLNELIKIKMEDNEAIMFNGAPVMTAKTQQRKESVTKASTSRPLKFTKNWAKQVAK